MKLEEKVIVSIYTGYLMCDFSHVHKKCEELLGKPVWTHELAYEEIQDKLHKLVKPEFMRLCEGGEG